MKTFTVRDPFQISIEFSPRDNSTTIFSPIEGRPDTEALNEALSSGFTLLKSTLIFSPPLIL